MRRLTPLAAALAVIAVFSGRAAAVPSFNDLEPGVRISSAVPGAVVGSASSPRIYYIRGSSLVYSASSSDGGLTFTEDAGIRLSSTTEPLLDIAISSITGLSVLPLSGSGYRMVYSVIGSTGDFRIYSATSADGINWANDTGTRIDGGTSFVGSPSLVDLGSGDWRLYYTHNVQGGASFAGNEIATALSTNYGRDFSSTETVVAQTAQQVAGVRRTDDRVRLYYTVAPSVGVATTTAIASALSADVNGLIFSLESGLRFSTSTGLGSISDPVVVKTTDTFRWRLYYDFKPFQVGLTTADVFSAVTDEPDPQAISPSHIIYAQGPGVFTISGEVLGSAAQPVTAELQMAGQPSIPATSVSVVSDQEVQCSFNTLSAALGYWNLVVTGADGQSTTLPNAVWQDFASGTVSMIDNLLRPRDGTKTTIAVTVYAAGTARVRVYTLDGHLVNTLYDGPIAQGTTNFTWDGRTAQGNLVASGVYLVEARGPKLEAVNKVVVIK